MKLFRISGIRDFMSGLLTRDVFDSFTVSEAVVKTFVTYTIDGSFISDYYSDEERASEDFPDEPFVRYRLIRGFLFEIIKGRRTPLAMKLVFHAPASLVADLIEKSSSSLSPSDVISLNITVSYKNGEVTAVTGTNYSVFSPDRSLDQEWDRYFEGFLARNSIDF